MAHLVRDDEEQLIVRSQSGDVNAFNQLVLHYQQSIYGVTYRMLGDADTAADVTQDVFIAAYRSIQSFHSGSSLRAWLHRIASNMVHDHWRRTRRHPAESLELLTDEDELHSASDLGMLVETELESNPEESLLNQELQQLLQYALQELPHDQRMAVILCDVEGLSYEEIAGATHTSLGTVRSRIARGRARLRNYLYTQRELLPREYRQPNNKE